MKKLVYPLLLVAAGPLLAATDEHADHHPAPPAAASTPAPAADRMGAMHALMERIEKSRDRAERQKLLLEHRAAMREQMAAMKAEPPGCGMPMMQGDARAPAADRADPGKPDGAPAMGGMGGGMGGMEMGGMMKCHAQMQARQRTMLDLMDQMMRSEDAAKK
jgi:hypothetical protein